MGNYKNTQSNPLNSLFVQSKSNSSAKLTQNL